MKEGEGERESRYRGGGGVLSSAAGSAYNFSQALLAIATLNMVTRDFLSVCLFATVA